MAADIRDESAFALGTLERKLRAAKIAKDRGVGGPVFSAASYFMKSPPVQVEDRQARENLEAFIRGES